MDLSPSLQSALRFPVSVELSLLTGTASGAFIHALMSGPEPNDANGLDPAPDPAKIALVQQLFVQNLVPLRGMLAALVRDRDRVDDLVQETFLTVTAKAAVFREGSSFRGWCFTIARYKVLESFRARPSGEALSPEVLEALTAVEPAMPPNEARMEHLAGCMEKLAPQARRAIELRYQQSHTPPEIAHVMGWTTGAVKVALSRARIVLRECVERQLAQESF
jgi:RNA polymerase sigma-70 factor (ECF subfamily)